MVARNGHCKWWTLVSESVETILGNWELLDGAICMRTNLDDEQTPWDIVQ